MLLPQKSWDKLHYRYYEVSLISWPTLRDRRKMKIHNKTGHQLWWLVIPFCQILFNLLQNILDTSIDGRLWRKEAMDAIFFCFFVCLISVIFRSVLSVSALSWLPWFLFNDISLAQSYYQNAIKKTSYQWNIFVPNIKT